MSLDYEKGIGSRLVQVAENVPRVYEAGYVHGTAMGYASAFDAERMRKKTVTGKGMVVINDASDVIHDVNVKLTSDTLTDFSGVTVKRFGKNLLKINSFKNTFGGVSVKYDAESQVFTLNGTVARDSTNQVPLLNTVSSDTLTLSFEYVGGTMSGNTTLIGASNISYHLSDKIPYVSIGTGDPYHTRTVPVENAKYLVFQTYAHKNLQVFSNYQFRLILSTDIYTGYEPYHEKEYQSNSDGVLAGIKSISPCMTFVTDANVEMTVEYYAAGAGDDAYTLAAKIINRTIKEIPVGAFGGITKIGASAFRECAYLEKVVLDGIRYISSSSFAYCERLSTVEVPSTSPPYVSAYAFSESPIAHIIVPRGCGDVYKSATNWSAYADVIEEASE